MAHRTHKIISSALTAEATDTGREGAIRRGPCLSLAAALALVACGCAERAGPGLASGAVASLSQSLTSAPALAGHAALAQTSLVVEQNGRIEGGHAAVVTVNGTPLLTPGHELGVRNNGYIDTSRLVVADSVKLDNNATVGDIGASGVTVGQNATHGVVSAFAPPPALPPLLPVSASSTAVAVGNHQTVTLGLGSYGAVTVGNNATLRLTGGTYHVASLVVKQNARVELQSSGGLRVAGRVEVQQNAFVGPTWTGATARDLPIHVHGADGGGKWAFSAVQNARVRGLVLAPNGTADVYQNGAVQGAVAARFVQVRQNGRITWEDGLVGATCGGSCDDANPCTVDACVSGECTHAPVASGHACSDGNACNGAETCDGSGGCQPGAAPTVDDGNPCTVDACAPTSGITHTPAAAGVSCGDGDACNGAETCDGAGACAAGAPPALDDGNPCTTDACSPTTGVSHVPLAAGAACSSCGATCNPSGVCVAGSIDVDDGNPCTADACDPSTGVTHTPVASGTACSDGDACNGAETCDGNGACQGGVAPTVDDGNPCTIDACSASGGVTHAPLGAGATCSDGDACNGAETCNGSGACVAGAPPTLDDGDPCTVDACTPAGGITHAPAAAGTACLDGDVCDGAEQCDGSGACVAGSALIVDDGNPCTADACHPVTGVSHVALASGTACSDGDACNGVETCDGGGACVAGTAPTLDDGNPCTADSCDASAGVVHAPVAAGTSCSSCGATCSATGTCVAGSIDVDDGNPCTADACDPATGVTHTWLAAGTSCADGDACNGAETCSASGGCQAGVGPTLDDGNPCTVDACDAIAGVQHVPLVVGTTCSDGDACNGAETCDGTGACVRGAPPAVDDGNPCTADACSAATGVTHTPVSAGTSCADADSCNGAETCDVTGACVGGAPLVVD
ncbi:MAG: hypothetical protein IT374_09615, partial [Polyangiaceae bacterium]|nr:hypothetical protein [Polyangiaceae bacterium]